jgi:hypothetical protein
MKITKTIIAVMILCYAMLPVSTNLFASGDIDMSLVWIRLADEKAIIDDDGAEPAGQDWHIISCEAAEFSRDGFVWGHLYGVRP